MEELDLHGKRLHEVEPIFLEFLNRSRFSGTLLEVTFITGGGKIRDLLVRLSQQHDLYHYIPLHNRGCIVIEFE